MRRLFFILILLNLSCAPRIQIRKPTLYETEWQEKKIEISQANLADFQGEKFNYYVKWLGVTVGEVELQNLGKETFQGIDCYHILVTARSNRLLSRLFRVEDKFDAYISGETFKPIAFISNRREGRYRSHSRTYFDYQQQKIIYRSYLDGSLKEVKFTSQAYDPISCFYKFRSLDLSEGNSYSFPVLLRAKRWEVEITLIRKGLLEIRKQGVLEAFLVNLKAQSGKEKARGEAWVWFSADKRKVPLLGQLNVDIPIVGTLVVALK